ncbi:hypothetical protein [Salimicrobium flavidum]|uniref:hypothetical protein n=1 Tax=Salimicrobium flavidum TaxID=570947 RepID=UPI00190EE89A|nr:hypothetical protein [Salimicrobium flavidum]
MTLLYAKAREKFDEDFKNSPKAKNQQVAKEARRAKRTKSGKWLRRSSKRK